MTSLPTFSSLPRERLVQMGAFPPTFGGGSKLIGKYRFFFFSLPSHYSEGGLPYIYTADNVTLFLKMDAVAACASGTITLWYVMKKYSVSGKMFSAHSPPRPWNLWRKNKLCCVFFRVEFSLYSRISVYRFSVVWFSQSNDLFFFSFFGLS